ncbi:MAG: hypothetical protein K0S23_298 [Fluviicola sp.]|jgi:hypothetical protein|nr:hypothetical protein [Fluviicola sp.]
MGHCMFLNVRINYKKSGGFYKCDGSQQQQYTHLIRNAVI